MQDIAKKLAELYSWKETTTGLRKEEKKAHLTQESKAVIALITSIQSSPEGSNWAAKDKAFALYLQGKALNVYDEYDKEVEDTLSKAIKLDPTLVDAWNALGESYWKKGDLISAKNCFSGALSQKNATNKVSLRCLSMVLRHIGPSETEKAENIEESVKKAKEAVALDIKDATSWYILGNAHLTRFFSVGEGDGGSKLKSLSDLEAALRAYTQSEVAAGGNSSIADLHYNRAVLLTFKEDYAAAIEGYAKAGAMDPDWNLPKEMQTNILQYVDQVYQAVNAKGVLKPKKASILAQAAAAINYSSSSLTKVTFSQLKDGKNSGSVLCVKIGAIISPPGAAPPSIVCVDKNGAVGTVSLYGIDPHKGVQAGDSICIPNPIVKRIELTANSKTMQYSTVPTDYTQVEVNGYPYNKELYASPSLTLSIDAASKPDPQKVKPTKSAK